MAKIHEPKRIIYYKDAENEDCDLEVLCVYRVLRDCDPASILLLLRRLRISCEKPQSNPQDP